MALRWLRAGLLAGATLWVACWAHASANGNLPGGLGLGLLWLLTTATAAGLLARPASYARIVRWWSPVSSGCTCCSA